MNDCVSHANQVEAFSISLEIPKIHMYEPRQGRSAQEKTVEYYQTN